MDYIAPIKKQLDKEMHKVCTLFCLIGTPAETPRYFNFGKFEEDSKILTIVSTQRSSLGFWVKTPFNFIEVDKFWQQFKEYRTEFLKENYPTIKTI